MLGVLALYGLPRGPVRAAISLARRVSERGPAAAPTTYQTESGKKARWRPATTSGRYLSADEYEEQSQRATGDGLNALFSSPEYQAWLRKNHARIKMDGLEGTRQPNFEDD